MVDRSTTYLNELSEDMGYSYPSLGPVGICSSRGPRCWSGFLLPAEHLPIMAK